VLHVAPNVHVTTTSATAPQCTPAEPCPLQVALDAAPPGTTIAMHAGVYLGDFYVSTPVSLVAFIPVGARDKDVILDGGHRRRPLTFDNVPAHVDGLTFQNGLAERAGCVLIERVSQAADDVNNFTRCAFINCTSETIYAAPASDGLGGQQVAAAGAVGIYYSYSVGSTFEVSRSLIEGNYARVSGTSSVAAGGLLVRHLGPTVDSATYGHEEHLPFCNTMLVQAASDHLQYTSGIYRRVKGVIHAGRAVWKRVADANMMIPGAPLTPHMIAYCPSLKSWHIIPISPRMSIAKALQRHPPCTASSLSSWPLPKDDSLDHHTPMSVNKWVLNNGNGGVQVETIKFQCQDSALYCPTVQVVRATGAQAHRNGLYQQTNLTRAGRPTFTKTGDGLEKPQYIWYCAGPKEWIVSDDDPAEASDDQQVCSRGIATLETMAIHPLLATGWRFWDVDFWRTSRGRSGIRLHCAPLPDMTCNSVELVNGPLQDFHTGPYLLTNFSWNRRPTYALRPPLQSYIWYCGTFSEWVVSETDPTQLDPSDEKCSRALSSHPTPSPVPYHLAVRWAQYLDDEWVPATAPVSIRCVDDCPRVVVDILGIKPGSKHKIGVYESIGRLSIGEAPGQRAHRVYRRLFSTPESGLSYLYYHADRNCWVISSSLNQENEASVFVEACAGSPERGLMHAVNWSSTSSDPLDPSGVLDPQPALSCDVHKQNCVRINISAVLYTRHEYLIGVYEPLGYLHDRRPVYLHNFTEEAQGSEPRVHYMYYCAAFSKWVIGPAPSYDGRCPAWVASKSTSATHPLVNVQWVLTGDGVRWETTPMGIRVGCADEDITTTVLRQDTLASPSPSSTSNKPRGGHNGGPSSWKSQRGKEDPNAGAVQSPRDIFVDCNFTGNVAFAIGDGPAAGAILLDYGRTHVGDDPHGYIRRTIFRSNDATGLFSAGGAYMENTYPFRSTVTTFNEVQFLDNRGATGGLAVVSGKTNLNRVQFQRNFGFENGGGMSLIRQSNASGTSVVLRNNVAQKEGGAGYLDTSSSTTMVKSEFINNTCVENEGTTMRGGAVYIYDSKVLSVTGYAISACFLVLSSSELSCASGTPSSLTDGFGCVPENNSGAPSALGKGIQWPSAGENMKMTTSTALDAFFTTAVAVTVGCIGWYVRYRGRWSSGSGQGSKGRGKR
jgi:hypothetical protein